MPKLESKKEMLLENKITLNNDLFIGKGMGRKCYIHPEDKNLCIKIPSKRSKRSAQREISYLKRLHKIGKSFEMISDYKGDVETNFGTGNIYELIRDYDGNVSKSLEHYLKKNNHALNDKIINLIEELRRYLFTEHILFSDFRYGNLLMQKLNKEDDFKLVAIDGIGDNNQIPFLQYFRHLGLKRNIKKWEHFKTIVAKEFPNIAKNIKNFNDKL